MADRVISVRLKIEIDQARRDAKAVSAALMGVASSAQAAGNSGASMGKLASAAKGVGLAVSGAGALALGGMAALTVSTTRGGIAYNTLEQTSRAALKTVLGSASAASGQMEKLREFGKSSPFPRQVWISAQQQLLAFGMSAEKVIPTFQAIQDAVAASGGGSQQITEVVDVLAKVQSTGKVTADTLNELGARGIDAATLVGQAMHKTAAEVREDIQSQAISGTQFIDILTGAMETRFAGAAANVKATWTGAKDRIKGAVRDIGSVLATPLVDPQGGGAAVDWANAVADALRALEERLKPLMAALGDRAGPIIDNFTEKLKHLADWIRNADFKQIGSQIQSILPAIAGISAGFATMGAKSLPIIGNLVGGLKPLPVALAAAALASPELRSALFDLLSAAAPLIQVVAQGAQVLAGLLGPALTVVAALMQPVIGIVNVLGNVLGSLPGPIQAVIGGLVLFKALNMTGALSGITGAFQRFGSEMSAQKAYAAQAGQSIGNVNAAYSVAAAGVSRATSSVKGSLSSVAGFVGGPWMLALAAGATILGAFADSTADTVVKQTGLIDALEAGTGAINAQTEAFVLNKFETSGANDVYRQLGGDANDLTAAFLGNADAMARVRKLLQAGAEAGGLQAIKYRALLAVLDKAPTAMGNAQTAARDKAEADKDGAAAADASASAQLGLSGALSSTGAAATDAATRIQQLNADLSVYNQQNFGLQEAHDKWASGIDSLGDMFQKNSQGATKAAGSQDKYSDSLKRQAKVTADAKKQLQDLAEAQRKAEQEAREAALAAKQRRLDDLFGKQFDVQSTRDQFAAALAQAKKDIAEARKDKVVGATSLTGVSEGALANRDRMRNLVQQAQAAIQAEIDRGASKARISAVTRGLQAQLSGQAKSWGLNAREVKAYTNAIAQFGGVANTQVKPNLAAVRKEYAEQRAELKANTAEQVASAKESARTSSASAGATAAVEKHSAALDGDSKSAIENRAFFRQRVKDAQEELTQMSAQGASRQAITKRAKELAAELDIEAAKYGFNKKKVGEYTQAIRDSAVVIGRYPTLVAKANTAAALVTLRNFQRGVDRAMAKIKKNYQLGVTTTVPGTSRFLPGLSHTGGHQIAASGGYIRGPGGPKGDKIPAMLSDKEFVQQADATDYYGVPFMHALNKRMIPRDALPGFAGGGPINVKGQFKLAGGMGRAVAGISNAFRDELYGGFFGMPSGNIGGAGVQRWAPLVLEVLKMLRQPSWLLSHVLRRMNQESGGNPRAINLWDSNAARGTPSIGLMQTIGPTFAAHAGPFLRRGIYDPLANIYAGLHYALGRYPSLQYAMDKPGGYKLGGLVKGGDGASLAEFMRGSYRRGTRDSYVPMDGMYQLHRGERVIEAGNRGTQPIVINLRPDGSKWAAAVADTFHEGQDTGRIKVKVKR
jgi:tape measure domain-containing protein